MTLCKEYPSVCFQVPGADQANTIQWLFCMVRKSLPGVPHEILKDIVSVN